MRYVAAVGIVPGQLIKEVVSYCNMEGKELHVLVNMNTTRLYIPLPITCSPILQISHNNITYKADM